MWIFFQLTFFTPRQQPILPFQNLFYLDFALFQPVFKAVYKGYTNNGKTMLTRNRMSEKNLRLQFSVLTTRGQCNTECAQADNLLPCSDNKFFKITNNTRLN
jgi:hypothetical protein